MGKLRKDVFNFVYMLSQDNAIMDLLVYPALVLEFFQFHGLIFSQYLDGWSQEALDSTAFFRFFLLGDRDSEVAFWLCFAFSMLMFVTTARAIYQMFSMGGMANARLLRFLRLAMSLSAKPFFFPLLSNLLGPISKVVSQDSPDSVLSSPILAGVGAVGVAALVAIVTMVNMFWIEPRFSDKVKFAKISSRSELLLMTGKLVIEMFTVIHAPALLIISLWLTSLTSLAANFWYPAGYRLGLEMRINCFMFTSFLFGE